MRVIDVDTIVRKPKVPVQRARKFSAVLGTTSAKSCHEHKTGKKTQEGLVEETMWKPKKKEPADVIPQ